MSFRMKPAHRQDLEDILWPIFARGETAKQTALDRLLERLEINPDYMGLPGSGSVENNFRGLLKNTSGTPKFLNVVSEIVRTKLHPSDFREIEGLIELLSPYGYTLQAGTHDVTVIPLTEAPSMQQREADKSWMEQNVPSQSTQYLDSAMEKLGSSDWQGTLSDDRLSLEALTMNNDFGKGLSELVQRGIIQEGSTSGRKKETELLRAIYGFDSTYGSHGGGASEELARLGVFQTEEAVIFLTKKIRAARKAGITLNEWR